MANYNRRGMSSTVDHDTHPDQLQLTPGRVLIRMLDPEKESRGGIVIPDTAQANYSQGIVVRVGQNPFTGEPAGEEILAYDDDDRPIYAAMPWKIGDHLWIGHYAGTQLTLSYDDERDVEHAMVKEADIFGKVLPRGGDGE